MALVLLLRGINVGGHRRFRPAELARQLRHSDALNIGATGTFVVRRPVTRAKLRTEVLRRLPFDAEIMICDGRDVTGLVAHDFFADHPPRPDIIRFVSLLSRAARRTPSLPLDLPEGGEWLVRILACRQRFVIGVHRRQMKVISQLGRLDQVFGAPATTRSWGTWNAIAKALGSDSR